MSKGRDSINILLVNPPYADAYGKMAALVPSYPPLGLAYLGAVLSDYNVKILDMPQRSMDLKGFEKYVKNSDYNAILFTATTPTINTVGMLCKIVKQVSKDIITIVGGSHPTALPERTLDENEGIDIIVIGEGEITVKELIDFLDNKKSLNKVNGICYRKNNKIIRTEPRSLIQNLDALPFPRHDLLKLDSYTYWSQHGKKFAAIMTSRGCPQLCSFCSRGAFGNCFRRRSVENVMKEIKWLLEMGVDDIHIIDDNFTLVRESANKILDEIIKNYPHLYLALINGVRVDRIDKELIMKLKRANVYHLAYGIESGSQMILDSAGKGTTLNEITRAITLSKRAGIELIVGFFIIGLPGETEDTIRQTIAFAKKLRPDVVKFSTFVPFPGTKIYDDLKKAGRIKTENWREYGTYDVPVFEHENLTSRQIIYWQRKAYREFYLSPGIFPYMLKQIKTSINNPKLLKGILLETIPNFLTFIKP